MQYVDIIAIKFCRIRNIPTPVNDPVDYLMYPDTCTEVITTKP
jgi:hypothetical protein